MKKSKNAHPNNSHHDGYTVNSRQEHDIPGEKAHLRNRTIKKVIVAVVCVLLLFCGIGFIYFSIMMSRLNRSDQVNSGTLKKYEQQPSAAPQWTVESEDGVLNILLLGIDENSNGSDGRSDSNMLVSIDSKSKALRLVSFLRDSYLEIPTVGKNKLNAAYANGGVSLTMQTLVNNYRIDIIRYVSVNFSSFAAVIDRMGGLDVPMTAAACQDENANIGTDFSEGTNHLNGQQCLYYARIRSISDSFGHDDYGRAARQRQVIQLILEKTKSLNPFESSRILYDFLPFVKTNLSDGEVAYLATVSASASSYHTETLQMPAPGTFTDQSDIEGIGKVIDLDLGANCTLLRKFLYGSAASSGELGG